MFHDPPQWSVSDFWDPELTMDRGAVRIYYSARKRNGPLCVAMATADPSVRFVEKVYETCRSRPLRKRQESITWREL